MSAPEVSFVTSEAGLDALRPEWEDCLARAAAASIFVSFDWQRAWCAHYAPGRALRIAVARRGGRLTGILPLYVGAAPLAPGLPGRVLRLVGSGGDTSPDYLGPVVDEDGAPETLDALCRAALLDRGWDALDVTDVLATSPFLARLEHACRQAGLPVLRTAGWSIFVARLPASWPEFLKALGHDRAKDVRRALRLCEGAGGRFFTWAGDPPLDEVVDRLAELHRLRWDGRAETCAFSSPQYLGFHRELMHALAARGRLRLYCLALDGALVAVKYAYAFRGEIAHFQSGFDPARQRLSPGVALTAYAVQQAIAEGASLVDMLKGEYPHKAYWANDRRTTAGVRAYRTHVRGRLLRFRREVLAPVRRAHSHAHNTP
jgi:CelD/BcsL family acetyltransferase involved in cellulose biosynthesis